MPAWSRRRMPRPTPSAWPASRWSIQQAASPGPARPPREGEEALTAGKSPARARLRSVVTTGSLRSLRPPPPRCARPCSPPSTVRLPGHSPARSSAFVSSGSPRRWKATKDPHVALAAVDIEQPASFHKQFAARCAIEPVAEAGALADARSPRRGQPDPQRVPRLTALMPPAAVDGCRCPCRRRSTTARRVLAKRQRSEGQLHSHRRPVCRRSPTALNQLPLSRSHHTRKSNTHRDRDAVAVGCRGGVGRRCPHNVLSAAARARDRIHPSCQHWGKSLRSGRPFGSSWRSAVLRFRRCKTAKFRDS